MPNVLLYSGESYDHKSFDTTNAAEFSDKGFQVDYTSKPLSVETAANAKGYDAICAFVNDDLSAPVIEALAANGVKGILMRCAGFDRVDLEAAAKNNLRVLRVPAYSPEAVAEHAVTLVLTLSRKTHIAYSRVRNADFRLSGLTGFNINGKTVGVVGTGRIGTAVAKAFKGFGTEVIGYDPFENDFFKEVGTYVSKEELFKRADIITLHAPATPENVHMISKDSIESMKDGVVIVNAARGVLVDTAALIEELKVGKVQAYGADVYENEGPLFFKDHSETGFNDDDLAARLVSFPNVLLTGHQAFLTDTALNQIANVTLSNLGVLLSGEESATEVKAK